MAASPVLSVAPSVLTDPQRQASPLPGPPLPEPCPLARCLQGSRVLPTPPPALSAVPACLCAWPCSRRKLILVPGGHPPTVSEVFGGPING